MSDLAQTGADRAGLRWNGWGFRDRAFDLAGARRAAVLAALEARFGRRLEPPPPAAPLHEARLPPVRLADDARAALEAAVGAAHVRTDDADRAHHAAGKSFADLIRTRAGRLDRAPDAVVYPGSAAEVAATLCAARAHALAVVPFGGGTSVVGGVDPLLQSGRRAVVALDTTRLDRLLALDEESRTATFECGIFGPALEDALARRGYTLGHFPQSFEHSTLGGWIAARSSGQQSDGYGGIDHLLVAARMVTPEGDLATLPVPRHAAGPDLREAILGSEGTLGVIVEATVRVSAKPAVRDVRAMMFRDFASGVAGLRAMRDAGLPMTLLRLSDARETELSMLLRGPARRLDPTALFLGAARAAGYADERSVLLFGVEGDGRARVAEAMLRAQATGMAAGGLPLGRGPGRRWERERFHTPYLRDVLFDAGVAIDTMETAFSWRALLGGHARVVAALERAAREHAGGGVAMGHVSHSYADGACVYFIVLYPLAREGALEQWRAIKRAATEAIVESGGTVSHHHGVGTDHAPWLAREKGALGMATLRALKSALDPEGTMNPGKLL